MITEWSTGNRIDNPDGSSPTWKKTNNPNKPAAYIKGTNATMFATITISPSLSTPVAANLRVKLGTTVVATKNGISLSGGSATVTGITTTNPLSNDVQKTTPTFAWELSFDGGSSWTPIGSSGPHTLYWTYGNAWTPPFQDGNFSAGRTTTYPAIYDKALERSCGKVSASSDIDTIITQISAGIDADIVYDPDRWVSGHPLFAYDNPGGCECRNHAFLLEGLLNTIGLHSFAVWAFGGRNSGVCTAYHFGSANPSFRISRAAHDSASANPHFWYHVLVVYSTFDTGDNMLLYDPSYGMSYNLGALKTAITEVHGGARGVSADAYLTFPIPAKEHLGWTCPH